MNAGSLMDDMVTGKLTGKRSRYLCMTRTIVVISWKSILQPIAAFSNSILQPIAAFSTTQAKYMSMTKGIKSLRLKVEKPILNCDNESVFCLSKNPVYHERTKHIDIQFNCNNDIVEEEKFSVLKIYTKMNPTDSLSYAWTWLMFTGVKSPRGIVAARDGKLLDFWSEVELRSKHLPAFRIKCFLKKCYFPSVVACATSCTTIDPPLEWVREQFSYRQDYPQSEFVKPQTRVELQILKSA
ncbi:hypothetical protein LXL04_030453 [Taraxacum kok-saghyz]